MIDTNIGIGFAARWNIKKMEQINENPAILKQIRTLNRTDYIGFLWDIEGGMLRYSETLNQVGQEGKKITFDNGIIVDLEDLSARALSQKFGTGIPKNLYYDAGTGPTKNELIGASLPYSVFVFKKQDGHYACILMDEIIAESLLIRLYFWGPGTSKYIEPFLEAHDATKQTQLFAFKVDWKKFINDLESKP